MPRKSVKKVDRNSQEYWNRRLAKLGLSVDAGRDPRMVVVGNLQDVAFIEGAERTRKENGKSYDSNRTRKT